jgi:hypothetical protein
VLPIPAAVVADPALWRTSTLWRRRDAALTALFALLGLAAPFVGPSVTVAVGNFLATYHRARDRAAPPGPPLDQGPLRGTRLLALAVLVYAGCSLAMASSAGLHLLAADAHLRRDPASGTYAGAGGAAGVVGALLAVASLALLVAAVGRLKRERPYLAPAAAGWVNLARLAMALGYGFLTLVPLAVLSFVLGPHDSGRLYGTAVAAVAAAALAFLAGVALLPSAMAQPPGRYLAWGAVVLGAVAQVALLWVSVANALAPGLGRPRDGDWLTLGGVPLVNWNLPFGLMAAGSALALWASYRFLPSGLIPGAPPPPGPARAVAEAWAAGPGRRMPSPLRTVRATVAVLVLALATAGAGLTGLAMAAHPWIDGDYLNSEPWLVQLGPDRLGVEFINFNIGPGDGILFGIINGRGDWVTGPDTVATGGPGSTLTNALTLADGGGRIHMAWSVEDFGNDLQTFYYTQLDAQGHPRIQTGPLGSRGVSLEGPAAPVGLRINPGGLELAWRDDGNFTIVPLNFDGSPAGPPYQVATIENGSFFPQRHAAPDEAYYNRGASVLNTPDGHTYQLWARERSWMEGREYLSEDDLMFRRDGPGGTLVRVLYSTQDLLWLTEPGVLPSTMLLFAGALATPFLAVRLGRLLGPRARGPPTEG